MSATERKWERLERLWFRVLSQESTVGIRSGQWEVKKEFSGDGLGPIAGDLDEIAVYDHSLAGFSKTEIGRWTLQEVTDA